jgi:hypothetical protein
MGDMDWNAVVEDRDRWRALVNAVISINVKLGRVRVTIVAVEAQKDNIKCFIIFSTNFARNISHSKKNSAKYCCKCKVTFILVKF